MAMTNLSQLTLVYSLPTFQLTSSLTSSFLCEDLLPYVDFYDWYRKLWTNEVCSKRFFVF